MRILPMIRVEMKRGFFVLWIALFMLCVFNIRGVYDYFDSLACLVVDRTDMVTYVHNYEMYTSVGTYISDYELFTGLTWAIVLAFVQFGRDGLEFKKALPFTRKELLTAKMSVGVVIAVVAYAVFFVVTAFILRKNMYIVDALGWTEKIKGGVINQNLVSLAGVAMIALKELLWGLMFYSFFVLCNTLCKQPFYGCALGVGLMATVGVALNYLNDVLNPRGLYLFYVYDGSPLTGVLLIFAVVLFTSLSFLLYGGGASRHPFFKYDWVQWVAIATVALFGACLTPSAIGGGALGFIAGAVVYGAIAAIVNKAVKRGLKQ